MKMDAKTAKPRKEDSARAYMNSYIEQKRVVEYCEMELNTLNATADSISCGTGASDRTEQLATRIEDMRDDIVERKIEALERQHEISETLSRYPTHGIREQNEKLVLFHRYIEGKSARETAEEMSIDLSYVHLLTKSGLGKISEMIERGGKGDAPQKTGLRPENP